MAGPSVLVRIISDVKGFVDGAEKTGSAGESAGKRIHGAFSSVLGMLNRSGVLGPFGDALAGVDAALESISEKGASLGTKLIGMGGAIAGVGLGLQSIGSKEQEATNQLAQAIENAGGSYGDYATRIESAVKSQEKFGTTAVGTKSALEALTQATGDPAKALDYLQVAADLAATKHIGLKEAATTVGKAFNGNTKALRAFGITSKVSGSDAVDLLGQKLQGQAAAGADSFNGKIRAMRASIEDSAASFANKFGPAITAGGALMTGTGAAMEVLSALNGKFEIATKLAAAGQWLLNLAMEANPILIVVVALAAITAAVILLYEKVNWFRDAVDAMGRVASAAFSSIVDAARAVINWLKANWEVVIAGVIAGPFGVAIVEIIKHKDAIVALFTKLPGEIASAIGAVGSFLLQKGEDFVNGIIHGVEAGIVSLLTTVAGIPGRVLGALGNVGRLLYDAGKAIISGLGKGIEDAVKGVLGDVAGIAGKIKDLKGPLPKDLRLLEPEGAAIIQGLGRGITGAMPALAKTLGTVTNSIAAGISPSSSGAAVAGSSGPAVVIQSATFTEGADIDLLLQRVAAASMAGRL